MTEEILLKAVNIKKSFPGVQALKGVNFELKKGEVHALVGENGAGKSTLMKIFAGVYAPDEGDIYIRGKKEIISGPKKAQELGISIIYQELNLCQHLSVAQNIFLGREPRRGLLIDEKKMINDAKEVLNYLNVDINPEEKVKNLPIGKQQMVEIAKAISLNSNILIMDEPTSALTNREVEELFKLIKRLKEKGVGIIYISHRLEELYLIADRITIFRDGEYIQTLEFDKTNMDEIIKLMVGRQLNEKFPRVETRKGKKILEVKNVWRKGVLHDINFELFEGEILGFAGLMGAGRTELARAIFGADKIEKGEIWLEGKKLTINSPRDAIENGIVYVPEDRKKQGLALIMDIEQNLTLPNIDIIKSKLFLSSKKEEELSRDIVKKLNIKCSSLKQRAMNLSGGNQQKVVVGKWLPKNLKVLIIDEPTRGIDVASKIEIYNILNELKLKGIGIIMISSELPEILGMSDRIAVMSEGRLTAILDRTEATQEKIMQYATLKIANN